MDKRITALLIIIALLAIGVGYGLYTHHQDAPKTVANNTTFLNNTTVKNATLDETETSSSSDFESEEYGYCAICGKALTYSEAHSEILQGKVCRDCANNPDYQTGEGAKYANEKLYEAYPDEYEWLHESYQSDDSNHEDDGDDGKNSGDKDD